MVTPSFAAECGLRSSLAHTPDFLDGVWSLCCRLGEASNPGPHRSHGTSEPCFSVAIANPTAIHHKEHDVASLGAHVVCLAETSAVSSVQKSSAKALASHGYRTFFGAPVPPHSVDALSDSYVRGAPGGVAICSSLPGRRSPEPLAPELDATTRLTEAFVRFGLLEVRVLALYGLPSSHADSKAVNQHLHTEVLRRLAASKVPTLIAGDFNVRVQSLPCWEQYVQLGFHEAHDAAFRMLGLRLAATCRGATRHDSALFNGPLVDMFTHAEVLEDDFRFDAHSPLLLKFRRLDSLPLRKRWRQPQTWTDFEIEPEVFAEAYDTHTGHVDASIVAVDSHAAVETAFSCWAGAVEQAVDGALRIQHTRDPLQFPQPCLPKKYRGRCRPVKIVSRPCPQLPRAPRHGDFQPAYEATSVAVRMRTRQCRRLRTLLSGLRKVEAVDSPPDSVIQQLLNEWSAVLRAPGYRPSFVKWLLTWDFLPLVPLDWPTADWLQDVVQLVEFDCNALAARESRLRKQSFLMAVQLDEQHCSNRQGFKALKGPPRPPLSSVPSVHGQVAEVVTASPQHEVLFNVPRPASFLPGFPAVFCGQEGLVVQVEDGSVQVAFDAPVGHTSGRLEQTTFCSTTAELHDGFASYWAQFWGRDSPAEAADSALWPRFQSLLAEAPAKWDELPIQMNDPALWHAVLRRSSSRRATGPCGFAVAELKQLPPKAFQHMLDLCQAAVPYGMPSFLMHGRVCVLSKVDAPTAFGDGRPITVLSTIYRIWGSVLSTQLLHMWQHRLPPSVYGGVPGRAARDTTFELQHRIELAQLSGDHLSGVVLDLTKCFNLLPRPPLRDLLCHLGCPEELATCWLTSLQMVRRTPMFFGCMHGDIASTTGAPEGDSLSVAAIVALNWLYATQLQRFDLEAALFVDNWSWTTDQYEIHAVGVAETLDLVAALRLQVDWKKAFVWSVQAEGEQWWTENGPHLFPPGVAVPALRHARDLGASMHYRGRQRLGCLTSRLHEGEVRLKRLAQEPRSIASKAVLVQTSVWPAAFYAAESHCIGQTRIRRLRGFACRALVGAHAQASPLLALGALCGRVQDPEAYLLCQALRTLQGLCHSRPALFASVVALAASSSGTPGSVKGPATALKTLLTRNGWTLDFAGCCKGPGHYRIDLRTVSRADITRSVNRAWAERVRAEVAHRNGLCGVGTPDPQLTFRVLSRFSPLQQKLLARHVVGAFQSGASKQLWSSDLCGLCPGCGQPEDKRHRFLECPCHDDLRVRHPDAIRALADTFPHWVHCPYAVVPDSVDVLTLVFQSRPAPVLPAAEASRLAGDRRSQLVCYTDGTCASPAISHARHAAWAVVCDDSTNAFSRDAAMQVWRADKLQPAYFSVRSQGLVPGRQTVARAELCAALQAMRLARLANVPLCVVTDSSYVVRVLQGFGKGLTAKDFCRAANLDLILLMEATWVPGTAVRKVKSHVPDCEALRATAHCLWDILGNRAVDAACKSALQLDMDIVHELAHATKVAVQEQLVALRQVFAYLLELNAAQLLLQPRQNSGGSQVAAPHMDCPVLQDGSPAVQRWTTLRTRVWVGPPSPPPTRAVFLGSPWGVRFTWMVWHWSQMVVWYKQEPGPASGTTALELLCHFLVTTGELPPVRIVADDGKSRMVSCPIDQVRQIP